MLRSTRTSTVFEAKSSPTWCVTLFIAGDLDTARRSIRRMAYEEGMCVTVTPTTFIYTGGEEAGVAVGLVEYPKYPSTPEAITERAHKLALVLIRALNQRTALVVSPDRTEWLHVKPPGDEQ